MRDNLCLTFPELGYFSENDIRNLKKIMDGKTYYNFFVAWSNDAGNCTLVVYASGNFDDAKEIRSTFLNCALCELARFARE